MAYRLRIVRDQDAIRAMIEGAPLFLFRRLRDPEDAVFTDVLLGGLDDPVVTALFVDFIALSGGWREVLTFADIGPGLDPGDARMSARRDAIVALVSRSHPLGEGAVAEVWETRDLGKTDLHIRFG